MKGELEKQIVDGLNPDNYIGWKEKEAWEAAKTRILNLIEEAREEFPDFAKSNSVVSQFEMEAQKWFLKYFGSASE